MRDQRLLRNSVQIVHVVRHNQDKPIEVAIDDNLGDPFGDRTHMSPTNAPGVMALRLSLRAAKRSDPGLTSLMLGFRLYPNAISSKHSISTPSSNVLPVFCLCRRSLPGISVTSP